MFSSLYFIYDNLSYRKKLLYSYLLLVLLPLLILSLVSMQALNKASERRLEELYTLRLEHTYDMLDTTFSEMLEHATSVAGMQSIRSCLSKSGTIPLMEQAADLETIRSAVNTLYYNRERFSIRVFVPDELRYSFRRVVTWPLSEMSEYLQNSQQPYLSSPVITLPSDYQPPMSDVQRVISVMMPIYHEHSYGQMVGIACVDISETSVLDIISSSDFCGASTVFLLDKTMTPVLSDSSEAVSLSEAYSQAINGDARIFTTELLWNTYYISLAVPAASILQPNHVTSYILLLGLVLGCAVMAVASAYARQNSKRIIELSKNVSAISDGNLDTHCIVDSSDEIGDLQLAFNNMIDQMNEMMRQQYALGVSLNANELKLLQAQIDPHFLYNTLNLIIWTAQNRSSDEVCSIVQELSDYYRLSLSKGQDFISLENEIRHVSLYVDLQNRRFENKIILNISVDPAISQVRIPNLLLQPIVENSIVHGFGNEMGTIRINAAVHGSSIQITVEDDGLGLRPNETEFLMFQMGSHQSSSAKKGYGLVNIAERLFRLYGDYGKIEISSEAGSMTAVQITIPYTSEN